MPAPIPPSAAPTVPDNPDRTEGQDIFTAKAFTFTDWFAPFTAWLETVVDYISNAITWVDGQVISVGNDADTASAAAISAAASAASAASSPSTSATSTSSLTPGLGSKSLSLVETGKNFAASQFVLIADTTTPTTKFLRGAITAFNSGTGAMTVTVSDFKGSTAGTTWAVSLSTPPNSYGMKLPRVIITGTSQSAEVFGDYQLANSSAAITVTLPASPLADEKIYFDNSSTRFDHVIARNGKPIMGVSQDMVIDLQGPFVLQFVDNTYGWRLAQ